MINYFSVAKNQIILIIITHRPVPAGEPGLGTGDIADEPKTIII